MFDELSSRRQEPVEQTQDSTPRIEKMGTDGGDVPTRPNQTAEPWNDTSRQAPLDVDIEPEPLDLTKSEQALVASTVESSGQVSFGSARVNVRCEGCVGTHTGTGIRIDVKG